MASRWLSWCRCLFRSVRISDHWPAAGRVSTDRSNQPDRLLASPGEAAAACALFHDCGGSRLAPLQGGAIRAASASPRSVLDAVLWGQLAFRRQRPGLLRAVCVCLAVTAYLVAGG